MCRKLTYLVSFALAMGLAADAASGQEPVKINFQDEGYDIPEGYLPDYGQVFGDRGNGYIYGWDSDITGSAHDRAGTHPEQRYDTNIEMQDPTNRTWEIELPNGIYDIFLVCGDAYYDDHISNMDVEGNILEDLDGRSTFDEYSLTALVRDGRLTIRPGPGAIKTGLVFVHITRVEMLTAYGPSPDEGATHPDKWVSLSWLAGDAAVSHDVYFGDNFDEVNEGTGDTFLGNEADTSFILGIGGYDYPEGLIPDTTYYWRIDEVNEDHPDSPWTGEVWSFKIAVQTAYDPDPSDGATMVNLDATLNWTAGVGAVLHRVYLGTDEEAVRDATTDSFEYMGRKTSTSYEPDFLEKGYTYYWRIDEYDGETTHKGDVWSFSTIPIIPIEDPNLLCWWKFDEGSETVAFDYSGYDHHGVINEASLELDGQIGEALYFNGTTGSYVVDEDAGAYINGLSAVTVCMWIRADEIKTNRGFINSEEPARRDDYGVAMRYDSSGYAGGGVNVFKMVVRSAPPVKAQRLESSSYVQSTDWQHVAMTWTSGDIVRFYINARENTPTFNDSPNEAGCTITGCSKIIVGKGGEPGPYGVWKGLIDDAHIYNRALSEDEIKQVMRGESDLAWNPTPANGSTPDLHRALPLSWSPGEFADQHDVYFGTDKEAVADANTSDTSGIYRVRQATTSYSPVEGVEWGAGPYYWRVDEYNTDGTVSTGRVWQFTVADFISVEDFEDYNNSSPERIFETWRGGYGYTGYCGNGTGSAVGHAQSPFAEETIVNSGQQSMPLYYDNSGTGVNICGLPINKYYSEAKRSLTYPRDWTEQGVRALTLWFRGYAAGFKEGPAGIYTMTASGADIAGTSDQFRYVYKRLSGSGRIEMQVLSVEDTHIWAKAGVMIRRNLDPGSPFAALYITPGAGCRFQARLALGADHSSDSSVGTDEEWAITAPYWIRLERNSSEHSFRGYHSSDGVDWRPMAWNPQYIVMPEEVYIGMALTSHSISSICTAQFSDIGTDGLISPPTWTDEVIGTTMLSNDAEPVYVAIANNAGPPAVVYHDDPSAAQIDTWTEWNIDLKDIEAKGVNLADVNSVAVGFGRRDSLQAGGSGLVYFDDFRLYRPKCVPGELTLSEADLNGDCVVDFRDLEMVTGDWLATGPDVAADLNADSTVDLKDCAVLADQWLEERLWPE
ncbi:MAG: hypothetical protein JSU70_07410 [Phycisphaerales bacterium]|nr:MAG: hypothetical protein JSU70_07410 [Phycisphaerales bacterium]